MFRKLGVLLFLLSVGCSNPIEDILNSSHSAIKKVADSLQNYEVQIIYTQIDSTENGYVFNDHSFRSTPKNYFYPASTVKSPIVWLAAEYVANHPDLTIDTPYTAERDSLSHTIANDISQIYAVSDNEAYNRLYEILGRDYINKRLREIGLKDTRISHRLSTTSADVAQRTKTSFYPSYEAPTFYPSLKPDSQVESLSLNKIKKGVGYIKDGELINTPKDFSKKNYFALEDQHDFMKRLFFKDQFKPSKLLNVRPIEDIRIKKAMVTLPKDANYDTEHYYDSYGKFFMYGDSKEPIPEHIKIYNKVGYAYGTLTETAYIVDEQENVHFLLSATILVNDNGVFNDDTYEYDEVGIPFLAQLGREFYEYSIENKNENL